MDNVLLLNYDTFPSSDCERNQINVGSIGVAQPSCQCSENRYGADCLDFCDNDEMCNFGSCSLQNGNLGLSVSYLN